MGSRGSLEGFGEDWEGREGGRELEGVLRREDGRKDGF